MRSLFTVSALAGLVSLIGCQSMPVTSFDYDKNVDYLSYRTFSWLGEHPLSFHTMESHAGPLLERRLMESTRRHLEARGLRFVEDSGEADLLAAFTVGSRERIILDGYTAAAISGDQTSSSYWGNNNLVLGRFMEGQVCLDLFDTKAQRAIWHGTARETLPEDDVAYWRDGVERIMMEIAAGFPPDPKV